MASMLREYETIFVLNPELTDDAVKGVVDRLKEIITRMGGELLREENWGKRKLAFPIEKHQRGNYIHFHYVAPVGVLEEIERTLRNLDQAIRYLSTGHGYVKDIAAKRAEVERTARERAAQQQRARAEEERERREDREGDREEEGSEPNRREMEG
jgi:small subunit ribosomal protein S6